MIMIKFKTVEGKEFYLNITRVVHLAQVDEKHVEIYCGDNDTYTVQANIDDILRAMPGESV